MKALSVRQPWAHLIVSGNKDVENRTWRTSYRGSLLILASKTVDRDACAYFAREYRKAGFDWPSALPTGGIVGIVNLVNCVTESDSDWFDGPIGWLLEDARELPFTPWRGRLGLFDVPTGGLPFNP